MLETASRTQFQHTVEGTWGIFESPAGRVVYLLTKARLGTGTDPEERLTHLLRPVREVLSVSRLDFNQLLQRDLDDHRVSTKLLPYIIEPALTGPAFFPPLMAAILPFESNTPTDEFPALDDHGVQTDPEFPNSYFHEWQAGKAFRFQQLVEKGGDPHRVNLGRLAWNDEVAKLVVLDGQHRAMALLAIQRTLNESWGTASGAQYRHFYEHRIKHLLADAEQKGYKLNLSQVEYPVTVCWFPDYTGDGGNPHLAARKLFVDVNKNARAPSEARLILLSDTELVSVLTRSLLNRLREDDAPLPLFAIEYDNPDKDAARPTRWSVIANLNMLRNAVLRGVFGPRRYLRSLKESFGGRPNWDKMNEFMREQLHVRDLYSNEIADGERMLDRNTLGNDHFPIYDDEASAALIKKFRQTWGAAVLTVLGQLLPYRRHIEALNSLYEDWVTDDAIGSLAREAMFEGVGMYWTLRDSYQYWSERVSKGLTSSEERPEVVKAWKVIEEKGKEFSTRRAGAYLGKTSKEAVKSTDALYTFTNTHACQIGAVLTIGTLDQLASSRSVAELAQAVVNAWNTALETGPVDSRDRRLVLSRDAKNPLNQIPKMDTPLSVYFRYFWLELLCVPQAEEHLSGVVDSEVLRSCRDQARAHYFGYLVKETDKALRRTNPSWSVEKRQKEADKEVTKQLSRALKYWFGIQSAEFEQWKQAHYVAGEGQSDEDAQQEEPDEENEAELGEDEPDLEQELEELAQNDE